MSRAFVKEPDGEMPEALSERPVSRHRNLVTPRGLGLIEAAIQRLTRELGALQRQGEAAQSKRAEVQRDLRYWQARRAGAELVTDPREHDEVRFGHNVTIERDDGRRQTYRIVGEDEADPSHGLLSHASPLATALFGRQIGETVKAGHADIEIVAID